MMLSLEIVNQFLFWLGVFFLGWYAYIIAFNRGVPNIRTAPAIRKKIIGMLVEDSARRGGTPYTIIDPGSGNGLFTRQMARSLPHARVIGIEISRQSYFWSMMLKRLLKLDNLEYKRTDVFSYDFSGADAVVLFFYQLDRFGKKLHRELKPEALVTSNKFRLGDGWEPVEALKVKTLYPFQKELYVYRQAVTSSSIEAGN